MTRILKALGLTALAALAMSAMLASAAQAETSGVFTAGDTDFPKVGEDEHTPATIVGEQYGEPKNNVFIAFGSEVSCTNATFTGTDADGTATKLTMTPEYSHCFVRGTSRIATVTMNGCDYTFTQPTKVGAGPYTGKVDLTCPGTNVIEIHVYNGGTYTAHEDEVCTITVYPTGAEEGGHREQELGGQVTYTAGTFEGKDDLTVETDINTITASRHGLCAIFGGNHEENGIYKSTVTVKAFNDPAGEPHETLLDAWISEGV